MTYQIKEIFYTLQGEGAHAGRPAVLLRFAGCNLWSGKPDERSRATCGFCDTDFVGTNGSLGGNYASASAVVEAVCSRWPSTPGRSVRPYVVCTGGEPLMQLDDTLVTVFHSVDCEVAIETNGTLPVPGGIDWICVSPKAGTKLQVRSGDELKLVYPQAGITPEHYADLSFRYFFLQPLAGPAWSDNIRAASQYCLANPCWHLSLQIHKIVGLP
ncbi:MAG: 7-carboxy-7-deazaguanine synthase [Cyanobacteria bacterium NC_groundwater_1444_Ag_S-0.65um_54_12]|nr:7-carboxy-7-deazaguanine synthase [Cyanobacteria bacterium NC_groundwater_1444_Ag_S-0.65um_54_12]